MLGSAFLPFRDSCHHLQRQEICSDHLHHLASPKWTLSKNTVTKMSKRNRKIAKFMIPSTLSLCVDWVDPAWRHSEPASWSSRSAPMSTAPHMFVPRSSQAGSCRVNFVWIFLWKFGRLVHKRWQETWRQERNSSYEKLYFLPFLSFFYDQLKKLALVLKDGCSNDVVQVRLTFGHEPGKGNIGNDGSGEQWPSWFRWFW
jgi:hypothetical protein